MHEAYNFADVRHPSHGRTNKLPCVLQDCVVSGECYFLPLMCVARAMVLQGSCVAIAVLHRLCGGVPLMCCKSACVYSSAYNFVLQGLSGCLFLYWKIVLPESRVI